MKRPLSLLLAAVLACTACSSDPLSPQPAEAQDSTPPDTVIVTPSPSVPPLEPCIDSVISGQTLCGTYTVYENREARSGRTIDLSILVVKALDANPEPDPLVYFEGGPGGSSVNAASFIVNALEGIRARRDLVFVDQRGTGSSGRLACNTALPGGEASLFGTLFPADHIAACAQRLGADADLRLYTTPISVDDIDEVLGWLGYDQVNLFGTSYGTRVALSFLRRHPERVRTTIVNGVAPPHVNIHLFDAPNVDQSLSWLFDDCAQDAGCNAQYPTLRADLDTLAARFDDGPVPVEVQLSNGTTATVSFSRGDFGYAIRGMLYGPLASNIAPWTAEAIETGGWAGFPGYYVQRSRWVASSFATGMHLSVFCAEDIPFMTNGEVASVTQGTLLGSSLIRRYEQACDNWPRGTIPSNYHELVASELPVLIISGERDPATPPSWGDEIQAALPNSRHIIVPDAGHVPLSSCVLDLKRHFIETASVASLNDSCVGSF